MSKDITMCCINTMVARDNKKDALYAFILCDTNLFVCFKGANYIPNVPIGGKVTLSPKESNVYTLTSHMDINGNEVTISCKGCDFIHLLTGSTQESMKKILDIFRA